MELISGWLTLAGWTLVAVTLMTKSGIVTGLELEDPCDSSRLPTSSNPIEYDSYSRCDPRQGLFCNQTTARCDCYVVDSEYVDDTCRGKIGFPCKASPSFTIACGEYAYCEEHTGFCRCEEDYKVQSDDKFNCNSANPLVRVTWLGIPTLLMFVGLVLIYKIKI